MRPCLRRLCVIPVLVVALALAGCLPPAGSVGSARPRPAEPAGIRSRAPGARPTPGDYGTLPLYFVENRGQIDSRVGFVAHARGAASYFTSDGVTFAITSAHPRPDGGDPAGMVDGAQRYAVKLDFLGASPGARLVGAAATEATFNYFKGTPERWVTAVPTYAGAAYQGLWPGIDLVYGSEAGHLKYEFRLQPEADPRRIAFGYRGATSVTLNEQGAIDVRTPIGGLLDQPPVAYQDVDGRRVPVPAAFALEQDDDLGIAVVRFRLGAYDPGLPLVIDPAVFAYVGYIGGTNPNGFDDARGIAIDDDGNAYVGGATSSSEATFPETVGPDLTFNGGVDAFVAKVRADGTGLIYAGFIGGSGRDDGLDLAVDGSGAVYLAGQTFSTQSDTIPFPVTAAAFDKVHNGLSDAFVAKVNPTGTSLVYATFIGGQQLDRAEGIALEPGCQNICNAYVVGTTGSSHDPAVDTPPFPVTVGPDLTFNGGIVDPVLLTPPSDTFVLQVNAAGSALVYSGYIGGGGNERGMAIAVDVKGNVYLAGETTSSQDPATSNPVFPVTAGAFDTTFGGTSEAYVAKVRADGTGFAYVTYVGGSASELQPSMGIVVDAVGNAYVVGSTASGDIFPAGTTGADLTLGGSGDAFALKLNSVGSGLVWGTYIGGSQSDLGRGIDLDGAGNALVVGRAGSSESEGFPVANGPDLTFGGNGDAFIAKIAPSGATFTYVTYLGGAQFDEALGVAADTDGNAYVIGSVTSTESQGFPVQLGPDLTFNGGGVDVFVAKIRPTEVPPGPFTVNSTVDEPDLSAVGSTCDSARGTVERCTLRAAIMEANRHPLLPIIINLPAGTYTLTIPPGHAVPDDDPTGANGDLDISPDVNVTIVGAGAATTIIQACNAAANPRCAGIDRLFEVRAAATLTMSGVTIRNGHVDNEPGGGIFNRGTLTLSRSVLEANSASSGGGLGNQEGVATLTGVTISNNRAGVGGGVLSEVLDGSATLTLTNVTISDNVADSTGAGLVSEGGPSLPRATLSNVTVANNAAGTTFGTGGVIGATGSLRMRNTIVANNSNTAHNDVSCSGAGVISDGFNLVFPGLATNCGLNGQTDLTGVNPRLGPLQSNGGPVPTVALLTSSAAIDRGNPATPLDGQAGR
jgi:CSLREA domain-containing protein